MRAHMRGICAVLTCLAATVAQGAFVEASPRVPSPAGGERDRVRGKSPSLALSLRIKRSEEADGTAGKRVQTRIAINNADRPIGMHNAASG